MRWDFVWKYLFFVTVFWLLWTWAAALGLMDMRIREIERKICEELKSKASQWEQKYNDEIARKEQIFKEYPRFKKYFK